MNVYDRRFDRDNAALKGELSKCGGTLEFDDSSDDGDGYSYDEDGNRLVGPDNAVSFGPISKIKSKWEADDSGVPRTRREELARQRKEELQVLRARQCQVNNLKFTRSICDRFYWLNVALV